MIPKIDPDVKYIGSSRLRGLTATELRALTGAIVVTGTQNTPLVVILPYQTYLKMQAELQAARRFETRFWEDEAGMTSDCDPEPAARELVGELDGEGDE